MAERDRSTESGEFVEEYPTETFISAIRDARSAGTAEIADAVGCDRRTAYVRLRKLEEDGRVRSRKIGSNLLWEIAGEGSE